MAIADAQKCFARYQTRQKKAVMNKPKKGNLETHRALQAGMSIHGKNFGASLIAPAYAGFVDLCKGGCYVASPALP